MSQTPDQWLLSLDPAYRRRQRLAQQAEEETETQPQRVPDADQGPRGLAPGAEPPKLSPDGFLMMIADAGRYGPENVMDEDHYRLWY